jgi:6-pyruvoyl-tetrahydropterin synthase
VCIEGPIGDNGMVLDFKQLADIKMMIDKFDHAHVFWSQEDPEVIEFYKKHFRRVLVMNKNVTAENMTRWAHNAIQGWLNANFNDKIWNTVTDGRQTIPTPYTCAWVRVWETKTGSAWTNESDAADTLTYIHKDEA